MKKSFSLLLVTVSILLFSACNGGSSNNSSNSTPVDLDINASLYFTSSESGYVAQYTTNYNGESTITAYQISPQNLSWKPNSIAFYTASTGTIYAYVCDIDNQGTIWQYTVATDGSLTYTGESTQLPNDSTWTPSWIAFSNNNAYVTDPVAKLVWNLTVNPSNGVLSISNIESSVSLDGTISGINPNSLAINNNSAFVVGEPTGLLSTQTAGSPLIFNSTESGFLESSPLYLSPITSAAIYDDTYMAVFPESNSSVGYISDLTANWVAMFTTATPGAITKIIVGENVLNPSMLVILPTSFVTTFTGDSSFSSPLLLVTGNDSIVVADLYDISNNSSPTFIPYNEQLYIQLMLANIALNINRQYLNINLYLGNFTDINSLTHY